MAKLLRLLEQDCTLTHEQLASMTDMTVADVKAAIQRYEADKTILGYQAIVDWDRTDREAVTALIEKNGGSIDNLSVIYDHLKKKYPSFDLKDYGYSRFSSFLRSMENIMVRGNAVTIRTASRTKSKKS